MWNEFPDSNFLRRYYGRNLPLPLRGLFKQWVWPHEEIQREFGTVLFTGPKHLMAASDYAQTGFETIYTFKDGQLSSWASMILEDRGLLAPLTAEAQSELFKAISESYNAGGFPNFPDHDWWHWVLTEDSLYTELLPEANPLGGNIPRRSAADIFGKK